MRSDSKYTKAKNLFIKTYKHYAADKGNFGNEEKCANMGIMIPFWVVKTLAANLERRKCATKE